MLHVDLSLRLMHLPSVKLPKTPRRLHHLMLENHLVVVWRLELWRWHACAPVVNRRPVDVAFLNFLANFILHHCRAALPSDRAGRVRRRWRAVIHWHLFPRFRRVVGIEQRLFRWKIDFCRNCSFGLTLLARKCSTSRRRVVLRLHYLVGWCNVSIIIAASPVL